MRVSREQAAENRKRIVETAARMFSENGFDGVGVDAIMKGVGLTHGGFYGHFRSKDDLPPRRRGAHSSGAPKDRAAFTDLNDLVCDYLSERHRGRPADGCAIAALCGEMARQGEEMRRGVTAHVRAHWTVSRSCSGAAPQPSRRKRAIATLAGIIGALMLARAVEDPPFPMRFFPRRETLFGKAGRQARTIRLTPPGRSLRQRLPLRLDPRSAASHLRRDRQFVRCRNHQPSVPPESTPGRAAAPDDPAPRWRLGCI